jgi:FlaA1/EpsC-like NDP-sugar epimerase
MSLYLALLLHYENSIPRRLTGDLIMIFPVAASALLLVGFLAGCYECVLCYAGISELLRQLFSVSLTYLFLALLRRLGFLAIPDAVLIIGLTFAVLMTGGIRISSRLIRWYTVRIQKNEATRTLIIGGGRPRPC